MNLMFSPITEQTYRRMLEGWKAQAEEIDAFPQEVERSLTWVADALCDKSPSGEHRSLAYVVSEDGADVPLAVCELVLSKRSRYERWLKLLKVHLSPGLEARIEQGDVQAMETASNVYKAAVAGAFDAKLEHSADTLKLYGRNDDMLKLLVVLLARINAQDGADSSLSACKEGRWLVLRRRS